MKNLLLFSLVFTLQLSAQHLGMSFSDAQKQGVRVSHLDSMYQSALHADTSLAVFKTDSAQEAMTNAYVKLLQDFGKFLAQNNFAWEKPTRCFNRIYFNSDGTIDYFLYDFKGNPEELPSAEKQKEFNRLLNLFIKDYRIAVTAKVKFAQCSPTTYMPAKKE